MIFRLSVNAKGEIDLGPLPRLPAGALVEIVVPDDDAPLPPAYKDHGPIGNLRGILSTKKPRLTNSEAILITTAVLYHSPKSDDEEDWVESRLAKAQNRITYALGEAIYNAFRGESAIEDGNSFHFAYLDREGTNARRCDRCGCWLTDDDLPHSLDALESGYRVGEIFLCNQDYEAAFIRGEIPRPEGFWTSSGLIDDRG